jgi:predicted nucleotidyltransferase
MALLDSLREVVSEHPEVMCAWLFGSEARGTARADSDVDVAVLWFDAQQPLERALDLEAALSVRLGREVQVIIGHRAPADLVRRVLRDGVLLVDRDRSQRLAFEVRKRNEYYDMTPIWRLTRRLPLGVDP